MTALETSRAACLAAIGSFVPGSRADDLQRTLDALIAWSEAHHPELEFSGPGDQPTVGFRLATGGTVLWRVFPRMEDGAKVALLSGIRDAIPPDVREELATMIERIVGGPIRPNGALELPLQSLRDPRSLLLFGELLGCCLAVARDALQRR